MPDTSIADKLKRWQTCITAMTPKLEELQHLRDEHGELTDIVQGMEALLVEADLHTSNLRATTGKRQALERRGREVFGRIDMGLRSHHGKKSPELRQYGIDPLSTPSPRRRRTDEEPEKPPAPAAAADE